MRATNLLFVDAAMGICLGVLIAVLSGFSLLQALVDWNRSTTRWRRFASRLALVRFPLFWFGGPWTTYLFGWPWQPAALVAYVATLTVVFTAVALYPLYRFIVRCARTMGEGPDR